VPTATHALVVLRIALKAAMREDLIARNPASLVEAPRYRKRRGNPLSGGEATTLLEVIRQHRLYALVVLALTSGLRRGELVGLTWGAVRTADGFLHVRQQLQREKGKGLVVVHTKTERSEAPVVLTQLFLRALRGHRQRLIEERMQAGTAWKGSDNPVAEDALVFVSLRGTPLDGISVWKQWSRMLVSAKIEHRRLHDSRHTTGTLLRALGVPAEVVQLVLRHARITTTLGTYVHADLSQQREAAAALDELLGGVLG
jgi:integrase